MGVWPGNIHGSLDPRTETGVTPGTKATCNSVVYDANDQGGDAPIDTVVRAATGLIGES